LTSSNHSIGADFESLGLHKGNVSLVVVVKVLLYVKGSGS